VTLSGSHEKPTLSYSIAGVNEIPTMTAKDQLWIEAAKRYRLSSEHIRMARELGMNPRKLGGLANHRQEPWRMPLPEFIADLHERRFRRKRPKQPASLPVAQKPRQRGQDAPVLDASDEVPF
jgi:hypothetical protein